MYLVENYVIHSISYPVLFEFQIYFKGYQTLSEWNPRLYYVQNHNYLILTSQFLNLVEL